MSTDPRTIATELIRSAASDIDTMGIGEFLEGRDIADPDGGITEQVDDLIRTATVLVGWPATTPTPEDPMAALDISAERGLITRVLGQLALTVETASDEALRAAVRTLVQQAHRDLLRSTQYDAEPR